jgi:hypothetical protein
MLRLNWLDELVVVLLSELLLLPNRDLRRLEPLLLEVVEVVEVVSASAAVAVWSGAAMEAAAARSSAAMRERRGVLESEGRECMEWLWLRRLFGKGAALVRVDVVWCVADGKGQVASCGARD